MAVTTPATRDDADGGGAHAPAATHGSRWSVRQRAMLRELGLRAWPAPAAPPRAEPARRVDRVEPAEPVERVVRVAAPPQVSATRQGPVPATVAAVAAAAPPAPADWRPGDPAARPRSPRPDGVDAMDWPVLAEAVAGCRACRLCDGRTRTVFGTGSSAAHWMVVGEAPGEQEDLRGEPFVGKSGQLLDAMLRAIGVGRDPASPPQRAVYIANAVKCRPPGNRNPQPDEMAACEPFLVRQVALLRPRIILAMGRFAVQSLLRTDEPIGRLRGRVHRYEGVPLVVTYHPAYLLRNPQDKARAWDDLCRARRAMLAD